MKHLFFFAPLAALILTSCSTGGYGRFYEHTSANRYPAAKSVRVIQQSPLIARKLASEGYEEIGRSTFNGPPEPVERAVAQAKKVGADVVLVSTDYSHTDQHVAAIPHYQPDQTATVDSTTRVNADLYGRGGYSYGTATGHTTTQVTTPGTVSYSHVPVAVRKFDQFALYLKQTGHKPPPNSSPDIPLAKKTDTAGFYLSPYDGAYGPNRNGIFDASGVKSGSVVACPYTGKKIRIP